MKAPLSDMKTSKNTTPQDPQHKNKYRPADFHTLLQASMANPQDITRPGSVVLDTNKMAPLLLLTIKKAVAAELRGKWALWPHILKKDDVVHLYVNSIFFPSSRLASKCKFGMCPYWTKMCPLWTNFGVSTMDTFWCGHYGHILVWPLWTHFCSICPKNRVSLATIWNKKFLKNHFSQSLMSLQLNNNSMSMEVKKKNF